ncbi:MAG TPA: hypothetical protein VE866_15895 [Candidatus Binatia bacterium]|nr:hypothetical protein [Candidatus Binatia bacterium]
MSRRSDVVAVVLSVAFLPLAAFGQTPTASSPQALAYAAQSIAALTGGNPITDVTLTGTVTWNAGADTGTASLKALGTGESRMDLALSTGTRSEIRDAQTGTPLGQWINPDNTSGQFAPPNCWTDAAWFFPALGSLAAGQNVVLSYVGQEQRNGSNVQHLRSYVFQSAQVPTPTPQQLSTMDFYLDATTLLPVAVAFQVHPDNNEGMNLAVEVDFSNYQRISGVAVPLHIQRYQQGALMVDLTITGTSFNTGLTLSNFAIVQTT